MDISHLVILPPGSHPIGIGLGSLLGAFFLLHLPYMEVLKPGFIFRGFSLSALSLSASFCLVLAAGLIWGIFCRALTSFCSSKAVFFKPFLLSPASVLCMHIVLLHLLKASIMSEQTQEISMLRSS